MAIVLTCKHCGNKIKVTKLAMKGIISRGKYYCAKCNKWSEL